MISRSAWWWRWLWMVCSKTENLISWLSGVAMNAPCASATSMPVTEAELALHSVFQTTSQGPIILTRISEYRVYKSSNFAAGQDDWFLWEVHHWGATTTLTASCTLSEPETLFPYRHYLYGSYARGVTAGNKFYQFSSKIAADWMQSSWMIMFSLKLSFIRC